MGSWVIPGPNPRHPGALSPGVAALSIRDQLAAAVGAGSEGVPESSAGTTQLGQPSLDPLLDPLQPPPLGRARRSSGIVGGECLDDLFHGQAQRLQLASEKDSVEVALVEGAVAAGRPPRRTQHSAPLVEPDRVDGDTRRLGEGTDPQRGLTLDHGPDFSVTPMTTLLTITAQPNAPIACDMSGAGETLAERIAEYRRLFEHALRGRTSDDTSTTFRFADRPGVRDWLLDLVRREAACCPFLSYAVAVDGDGIVWTVSGESAALEDLLDYCPAPSG